MSPGNANILPMPNLGYTGVTPPPYFAYWGKARPKLLGSGMPSTDDLTRRIKAYSMAARPMHLPHFQALGSALLRRQRLVIDYQARGRGEASKREVSRQRLIHYRDNWYLDAWCHLRNALRSFAVECIPHPLTDFRTWHLQ
jgi:predicted DNA-binding transcriptional regulator YafY